VIHDLATSFSDAGCGQAGVDNRHDLFLAALETFDPEFAKGHRYDPDKKCRRVV
jgi:hypothetical protein